MDTMNKLAALGDLDEKGVWRDIDLAGHGGAAMAVWRMTDDERSPECEAQAERFVACWNAFLGIPTQTIGALAAAGGIPSMAARINELKGQAEVLRHLMGDALGVLRTVALDAESSEESDRVLALIDKTEQAIKSTYDDDQREGRRRRDVSPDLCPSCNGLGGRGAWLECKPCGGWGTVCPF